MDFSGTAVYTVPIRSRKPVFHMSSIPYFFDCTETIPAGVGFAPYGGAHLAWLVAAALCFAGGCLFYRRLCGRGRRRMRLVIAALTVGDELFKIWLLASHGNYTVDYLPLHLCSINIFIVLWHALRPRSETKEFLYAICLPGAMAALLFPSWSALPPTCGMHIHSFTVHILLALYPLLLTAGGEVHPQPRHIPRLLGLLALCAVPAVIVNQICGTNFMFLREAGPGNPLQPFEALFGTHLAGIPILIAAVLLILYTPWILAERRRAGRKNPTS